MRRVGNSRTHYKANNRCHTEDKPANHERDNPLWQGRNVSGIDFVKNPKVPNQGINNTSYKQHTVGPILLSEGWIIFSIPYYDGISVLQLMQLNTNIETKEMG